VLSSDSRLTRGPASRRVARNVMKVYVARPGFLIGWAGSEGASQAFVLAMQRTTGLSTSDDRVVIKRRLEQLIAEIREAGETDYAEWLVCWWSTRDKVGYALQLYSARPGQWVSGTWGFIGDERPQDIAQVVAETIRFVPRESLTLEQAKLLAFKVMRDTIHIGVDSIGGGVQIGSVSAAGTDVIRGEDLEGLDNALDVWEEQAAGLLPGSISVPAQSSTPDRGVRPPPAT
jgi:hypothetical protein